MKKGTGIALLAAALCIVIGAALIFVVLQANDYDFKNLTTAKAVETPYTVNEPFTSVRADCAFADCMIVPDPSGETAGRVVCTAYDGVRFDVQVQDGVLRVTCVDERTFSQRIGIFSEATNVVLYLKETAFDALNVQSTSGDVAVLDGLSFRDITVTTSGGDAAIASDAETITVTSSSGDAGLTGVTPRTVTCTTNSGQTSMVNVEASEHIRVQSSSGDVSLLGCDAPALNIQTHSGDVSGILASAKTFDVKTSGGDVNIPPDGDGGTCTVRTSSGDVRLRVN